MPLAKFICPDNKTIDTEDCLEQCRLSSRCLSRATLRVIAEQDRSWDGVPHVTGLLNGTMLEYLKITKDYAVNPKGRAFALLGSSHHKLLEGSRRELTVGEELVEHGQLSELHLSNGWVQGTLDLVERDGDELVMVDYKTWGSNRLARGVVGGYGFDPKQVDLMDVTLQMNMYRVLLHDIHDIQVGRMLVQVTVRDGGLSVAVKRGVKDTMYLIQVNAIDDAQVTSYFQSKSMLLRHYVDNNMAPEPCSVQENWSGNRCGAYCDVAKFCPLGR